MKADKDKKICPNSPESSSRLIEYSRSIERGSVVVNACGRRLACKGRFGWLATARMPLLIKRRSAKSALDSVERAPVGPVVAVCRHSVGRVFHKDGFRCGLRCNIIGSTQGEGGRVKKEGRKCVHTSDCTFLPS